MIKKHRMFDGKRYMLYATKGTRRFADRTADGLRALGLLARVIQLSDKNWGVYKKRR